MLMRDAALARLACRVDPDPGTIELRAPETAPCVASFALARFVTSLLYGVSGADPVTFGVVAVVLMAVATLATYIPAWKASRVNPVDALRI